MKITKKMVFYGFVLGLAITVSASTASADGAFRAGGVFVGADGGFVVGKRAGIRHDGGAGIFNNRIARGPNGNTAIRGFAAAPSTDGTGQANRWGGMSGENGSAARTSTVGGNGDGTWYGERSTTAVNANTGNSFEGDVTYDSATNEASRSAVCMDANGGVFDCK